MVKLPRWAERMGVWHVRLRPPCCCCWTGEAGGLRQKAPYGSSKSEFESLRSAPMSSTAGLISFGTASPEPARTS